MQPVARHLDIHGRVQGVFYRNWAIETARALNLVGWVRNRMDGHVEALVQGNAEAVERFIAMAHEGPPAAQVERVETLEASVESLDAFTKRPTA